MATVRSRTMSELKCWLCGYLTYISEVRYVRGTVAERMISPVTLRCRGEMRKLEGDTAGRLL